MMPDSEIQSKKVGYKNPPEHSKWKKGQSGNPAGKNKEKLSIQEMILNLAGEEITVHKNGAPMSMSRVEAALIAVFGKALKGDLPSMKFIAERVGFEPGERMDCSGARSIELDEAAIGILEHHSGWVAIVEEARARLRETEDCDPDQEVSDEGE